jgi:hypothetical protein
VGDDVGDELLPFLDPPNNFVSQPLLDLAGALEPLELLVAKSARPGIVTCFR